MELLKLLSTSEIIAQVINFLLLLALLRIFFWKRVLQFLDERKERIASDFKRIEDAKNEVERLKSDYEKKIASIEETAKEKMHAAVLEGGKIVSQIKKEAYAEAEKIIKTSREDIKYEIAKAKNELKDTIVDLTMKATENVIREKLTEEDDKKIVKGFLEQLDEMK